MRGSGRAASRRLQRAADAGRSRPAGRRPRPVRRLDLLLSARRRARALRKLSQPVTRLNEHDDWVLAQHLVLLIGLLFQSDACIVRGVCFRNGQRDPMNLNSRSVCVPSVSTSAFTLVEGESVINQVGCVKKTSKMKNKEG